MRTTKTLSVSLPPAQLKQAERLARKENRTMSELVREALRQYQQKQEAPVNADLIAALRAVQEDAKRAGLDKLTNREINAEVYAYRRQQRKKLNNPPDEPAAHSDRHERAHLRSHSARWRASPVNRIGRLQIF